MKQHPDKFILSPEQIAEIERRLREDEVASEEEVRAFFARLKAPVKSGRRQRR
jgi:hypothetical protein